MSDSLLIWKAVAPPFSRKSPSWVTCALAPSHKPEDIVEIQTVIAIRPTILATAPTID